MSAAIASSSARPPEMGPPRAITTPFWDGLLTGGLSLVGMGAVLIFLAAGGQVGFDEREWFTLTILLNSPHFMASYRVLYGSGENLRNHVWATLWVPVALSLVVFWIAFANRPEPVLGLLVLVSSVYLAWHYAGQTWGMVSTFSRLANFTYTDRERFALHLGPRCLLALHVILALYGRLPPATWIAPETWGTVYAFFLYMACAAVAASLIAGIWAFWSAQSRQGPVPIRAVLPWASYYLWYPFWILVPGGFFWLQLAHALQYMAFPLRIDLNRSRAGREAFPVSRRRLHVGLTYLGLVAAGALVLHGPPLAAHAFGEGWYSTATMRRLLLAVTHCVAIHHYFVDGAIWHLRDASVRRPLFAHLPVRKDTA